MPPKKRFTTSMQDVLDYLVDYKRKTGGFSPSIAEIMQSLGNKSSAHISYILNRLEEDGYIKRRPGRHEIKMVCKPELEQPGR